MQSFQAAAPFFLALTSAPLLTYSHEHWERHRVEPLLYAGNEPFEVLWAPAKDATRAPLWRVVPGTPNWEEQTQDQVERLYFLISLGSSGEPSVTVC